MNVTRRALASLPADTYDRLVAGSFFASRGFLDLYRTMGGRPIAWTIETDGALAAVLPGIEYGLGPVTRFASAPDGCYGGVFVDPRVNGDARRLAAALLDAVAARGYARAVMFDFYGSTQAHAGFVESRGETLVVELPSGDWEPPDPKLRSEIRKAGREGARVEAFDWARHHEGFLELVASTARRHGRPSRYRARFFQRLADLGARDPRVRFRMCTHDGRLAAAHVAFRERDALVSWQMYFDKQYSFAKPNQLMANELCREAAHEGVRQFNLGATPAHATGLQFYKSRWGGAPVTFPVRTRGSALGALLRLTPADRVLRAPAPETLDEILEREPVA